jgi:hypothetical protein
VLERKEPALQAKLAFERTTNQDPSSSTFAAYRRARRALDRASAMAGAQPLTLIAKNPTYVREVEPRRRMTARLMELQAWHDERQRELESDRNVAELFSRYRLFDVLMPSFVPATAPGKKEILSLYAHSVQGTQSLELLLEAGARARGHIDLAIERMAPNQMELVENNCQHWPLGHYFHLHSMGYQGLGLVNFQRQDAYQKWASPVVEPFMRELGTLAGSFAATGEVVLQLAHGSGTLNATQGYPWQNRSYGGRVLVSNVLPGPSRRKLWKRSASQAVHASESAATRSSASPARARSRCASRARSICQCPARVDSNAAEVAASPKRATQPCTTGSSTS